MRCKHCSHKPADKGRRGLCRSCHDRPEVRALYRQLVETNRLREVVNPLALAPTDAEPGSEEKIAVLIARASAGQSLHLGKDGGRFPSAPQIVGQQPARPLHKIRAKKLGISAAALFRREQRAKRRATA